MPLVTSMFASREQVWELVASSSAIPCSVHSAVCDRVHGQQTGVGTNGILECNFPLKNAHPVPETSCNLIVVLQCLDAIYSVNR
jgi:hypothetical protein